MADGPAGLRGVVAGPPHPRLGFLDPVRRKTGLALLSAAAVLVCAANRCFAATWSAASNDAGNYLYVGGWAVVASVALCGAFWARRSTGARRGDSALLVVAAVIATVEAAANLVAGLGWQASSLSTADAAQVLFAVGDVALGLFVVVLAARYGGRRVGPAGHRPLAPLLIAGIGCFGFVYGDVYNMSPFAETPLNDAVSSVLLGVAYGAVGGALILAAVLHLGPRYRLVAAGLALLLVGVAAAVVNGVAVRQQVVSVLYVYQSVGFLALAAVALASALLAPARPRPVTAPRPLAPPAAVSVVALPPRAVPMAAGPAGVTASLARSPGAPVLDPSPPSDAAWPPPAPPGWSPPVASWPPPAPPGWSPPLPGVWPPPVAATPRRPGSWLAIGAVLLVVCAGVGIAIGVASAGGPGTSGAPSGGLPPGQSLTSYEAALQFKLALPEPKGFSVSGIHHVVCNMPPSWSAGARYTCFVYDARGSDMGEVFGTVEATQPGDSFDTNVDWQPNPDYRGGPGTARRSDTTV